ncbi:hypothetical protein [Mesorhizobium escarrei]|uniref:Phage major capsid protein n=1 Tax=Mesorhizobium escarrei TaxID=666018 RepID=A0ABN8JXQ4_9HYPH|nr:hypothetical protein [Mesorhizobium escarrei]CAH2402767.1 conserved hypothetical protein [Mesorhizobium escarrei]
MGIAGEQLAGLQGKLEQLQAEKQVFLAQADVYTQQKVAAEAKMAAINADLAGQKALYPTLAGGKLEGAVTADSGAGAGEASLLAARIVRNIACRIAKEIEGLVEPDNRFIIFTGTERPNFGRWRAFRAWIDAIVIAFERSDAKLAEADELRTKLEGVEIERVRGGEKESAVSLTAAGALLDFGVKLGSYFLTDYKTSAVTVTGINDDFLALAVASRLKKSWYPARWMPSAADAELATLLEKVNGPQRASVSKIKTAQESAASFADLAGKEADNGKKLLFQEVSQAYNTVVQELTAAQKLLNDLTAGLMVADTKGVPLLASIMEEKAISDRLEIGDKALLLQLHVPIGSTYTKKNVWTFFGRMPFFVRGGVALSYSVVEGTTGNILKTGQFAEQSKFYRLHEVSSE